jgi:hypothetical protein
MAYVPNSSSVSSAVFEIIKQRERTRRRCCNCFATLVREEYVVVRNISWQFAEKVFYILLPDNISGQFSNTKTLTPT